MVGSTAEPKRWIALTGLCVAAGLVWLAFADLGIALPTISKELNVSLTDLQWTNNAFSLVCGALVLPAGRFGDLYGRRRMLLIGVVVFGAFALLTSLLSGLPGLIVGRALMGVGAAMILPATLALIPPLFPRAEQPAAFGAWMAVAWVGQAAGPAVGGLLTSGLGWRSLFWMITPFAALAFWIIWRYAPESSDEKAPHGLDVVGLAASAAAAFCLLYALTEGQSSGFGSPLIVILLVLAVVLGVGFVVAEQRIANPLVDLRLFQARDFDGALVANLVMNIVFAGISYLFALYLQDVRGYSAISAGWLLFPSTVTILAFNPTGGKQSARHGARIIVVAGLLLLGIGTVVSGILSTTSSYWILLFGLLILGAGLGLLSVPISDTAVAGPPQDLAGTASGLFKMSSMLGGALGVAVLSAIAKGIGTARAPAEAKAAGLTQDQIDQLSNSLAQSHNFGQVVNTLPEPTRSQVINAYQHAEAAGVAGAVKIGGLLAIAAAVLVLWLWPGALPDWVRWPWRKAHTPGTKSEPREGPDHGTTGDIQPTV